MDDSLKNVFDKLLKGMTTFNKAHEKEQNRFNILKAVRSSNDEVRLHSRFIASLLDPLAPHGANNIPLKLFLKHVGLDETIADDRNLSVRPNYYDKTEYKEMDILVRTEKRAVLIENKIFAKDSNDVEDTIEEVNGKKCIVKRKGQLERYYDSLVNEKDEIDGYGPYERQKKVSVLYLTTDGHSPSDISIGKDRTEDKFTELEQVNCVTYSYHILNWLKELVDGKYVNGYVRNQINQYVMIVKEMVNAMSVPERKEIVEIVGNLDDKERKALAILFSNEKDLCWHVADLFFQDLFSAANERHLTMMVKKNDEKERRVDDIYEMMPYILNDTVGVNGRKAKVEICFSNNRDKLALILDKGIVDFAGRKIDFNNLGSTDTINMANRDFRNDMIEKYFAERKF